jgi:hypothetical protein
MVLSGIFYSMIGKEAPQAVDPAELEEKEGKELSEDTPEKEAEAIAEEAA